MLGKRIRLEYSDQNEEFGRAFPRQGATGTLTRRVALEDWGHNWYLLELDRPFEYSGKSHDRVLIRSRWEGHEIGDEDPTSVFVLLIPDMTKLDRPVLSSRDFDHVAWGMAQKTT